MKLFINTIYNVRLNDERRRYSDKLWVSIMAGVTLSDLNLAINKVCIIMICVCDSLTRSHVSLCVPGDSAASSQDSEDNPQHPCQGEEGQRGRHLQRGLLRVGQGGRLLYILQCWPHSRDP